MIIEPMFKHDQLVYEARWKTYKVYGSTAKQAMNNMLGIIKAVIDGDMYK